ncbi:hypothetical protein M407DRAFT_27225 [Tulasnella calospora MUT 4182]|uniref:Uncharacterized protein n=1 Tax=Tulasnella calospora MUT 4182 TaxID=1051891 RepID=A0A0C3QCW5_9AGAM|nr:hypothetical protein M407DRAFT_27225 [Tulasnella calospora MUT 4182]
MPFSVVLGGLEARVDQDVAMVLRTTNSILAFAQQLVSVTQSRELDYSAVQTIANWFCHYCHGQGSWSGPDMKIQIAQVLPQQMAMKPWSVGRIGPVMQRGTTKTGCGSHGSLPSRTFSDPIDPYLTAFDLMAVAALKGNAATSVAQIQSFASVLPTSLDASGESMFPSLSFLGNHPWNEVQAMSPSCAEQEITLDSQFPKLAGAPLRVLLGIWKGIQEVLKTSPKNLRRHRGYASECQTKGLGEVG